MAALSSLVGLGMQAAGAITSAIGGAKAAKNIRNNVLNQQQANQDWYDRRYNEDATQKADAQRLLTMTEQSILNRNNQAAGAAAVGGASEESIAAQKAAGNQALANAVSNINANAEAEKNAIEQTYQARNDGYMNQLNQMEANRAANLAQAAGSMAQAGSDVMTSGALDNIFGKKS